MTAPELAAAAALEPEGPGTRRHALTYRPSEERYEWLRRRAFDQRRTMQSIIDEALDQLRGQTEEQQG